MSRDLSSEDFEDGREGQELLAETIDCPQYASLAQFLQEERQEGDEEDDKNRDDASLDPVIDRNEIVAAILIADELTIRGVSADEETSVHCAKKGEDNHEKLHGGDDEDVVDVEARMCVVEGQETIKGQLRAKIVTARQSVLPSNRQRVLTILEKASVLPFQCRSLSGN